MASPTLSPAKPSRASSAAAPGHPPVTPENDLCPIVAMGASAGGLEALEEFFENMPADSGMAFVVIQHLDPDRKALMPELLQRVTAMKVRLVRDRTRVRPNGIYILPPNKELSILNGVLHVFEPTDKRGHRFPINAFFTSLALDRGDKAMGLVLSGMGSDGTPGLRDIRAHGGLTLAQAPENAKFDSMPRSAIHADLVDVVRPVSQLPAALLAFLEHPGLLPGSHNTGALGSGMEKALLLLRDRTGHDFSVYKTNTIQRRIERRMRIHHLDAMEAYVRHLRDNPGEVDLLFKELLIGVTRFFRDPEAWERLKEALPPVLQAGAESGTFRAWIAGCSTGEEAYTAAIIIREALDELEGPRRIGLRIFAGDLDRDAVEKARRGRFPESISDDVSPERLERFFRKEENGDYRIHPEIRQSILFSVHNLVTDPPFTRLNLICCRNVLIYLTREMQEKLIPLFQYSLRPGGLLLLGSAESLGRHSHLLAEVDGAHRLHRKPASVDSPNFLDFPHRSLSHVPARLYGAPPSPPMRQNLQTLTENLILKTYAPATVLVDELGNILHISGRTGRYLEPAAGKANWNLFAMAREGLRTDLHRCFTKAMAQSGPVGTAGLCLREEDLQHYVDLKVEQLTEPPPLEGMLLILFSPALPPGPRKRTLLPKRRKDRHDDKRTAEQEADLEEARRDLRTAREEMQRYREELHSTIEELQSTNEELQSSNEELQSSNEELTTSREEMQSLNEELQTVNAELRGKLNQRNRNQEGPKPEDPS